MQETNPMLFEKVASGLADHGYVAVDHFLTEQEVDRILEVDEFRNGLLHFKKAGIGKSADKQINESVRGDYIKWIDPGKADPSLRVYLDRLEEMTAYLNRELYLSLKDLEVHLTIYPAGTFYKRHLDQFKADDHRRLSVICYLNKNWREEEGGQLRMHLPGGAVDILPLSGRLVCFRSDQIEHEVLPATRERLSLTGWLLDRERDLVR